MRSDFSLNAKRYNKVHTEYILLRIDSRTVNRVDSILHDSSYRSEKRRITPPLRYRHDLLLEAFTEALTEMILSKANSDDSGNEVGRSRRRNMHTESNTLKNTAYNQRQRRMSRRTNPYVLVWTGETMNLYLN